MKAKDFTVLRCESSDRLESQVKNLIEEGWELNGNMEMIRNPALTPGFTSTNISSHLYIQSMVLPEEVKPMEERGYIKVKCYKCESRGTNQVNFSDGRGSGWRQEPCANCKGRGFNWGHEA